MLTNINTDSLHLSQPISFPQEENKSTSVAHAVQLSECSVDLCTPPLNRLDLVELLYQKELLPNMKSTGQPFIKVSRRKYDFLENSILANHSGEIFEHYHWKGKDGNKIADVEKKGFLGIGSYKRVWDLKPLTLNLTPTQRVRARFHWNLSRSPTVQEQLNKLEEFKKKVNPRFLLIPDSSIYIASSGLTAIVQMMPKAFGGDLFDVLKKEDRLSYLGRLRAIYNLGVAITDMHEINWVHLDVKPHNTMLMTQDVNHPTSKLIDFDFAKEFKPNDTSSYCKGTPRYMDPKCLNKKTRGLEDAKIHDQFSFGVTFYELLTGQVFRESFDLMLLKEWVKESDLTASPRFLKLNERIQDIIRGCCLGSSEIRPYRLPQFLPILEELITLGSL